MKNRILTLALACVMSYALAAKNTVTTVTQVSTAVTLSEDVDYVITDASAPFTATGSINITNTEHATVILQNIKPSLALAHLGFININGAPAENDVNCQVKMYAQGAIIMPYSSDIKPLTVYSEQNFEGTAVNDFGLENSGGFMNTLSSAKLNNQIRSFKLKRGYMVTFSNLASGRGYSRCFIADTEDLEMATLPAVLDRHISSYRIFVWNDAQKKGVAVNNESPDEVPEALNVSWCYHSWTLGHSKYPDIEYVPHHYKESWPSPAECGNVTYSAHLKNNNEPANPSDEEPATVEEVLANWENLMATGLRLCSPSSHDGSGITWLYNFMNEIDARGWRCDIMDMHAYWTAGNFNNLQSIYNTYKRPFWLSEMLWGSSWGGGNPDTGFFAVVSSTDERNNFNNATGQQKNYDGMKPIIDNLNNWPYVERYAYWNSWGGASQLYVNGTYSKLGQYYAEMNTGIGYNKAYEYVPKVVLKAPENFTVTFNKDTREVSFAWNNINNELTDSTYLEVRQGDEEEWTVIRQYPNTEATSLLYRETLDDEISGIRTYRVHAFDMDGIERFSQEQSITVSGVQGTEGTDELQYGNIQISDTQVNTQPFRASDNDMGVIIGPVSYNNRNVAPVAKVNRVNTSDFELCYFPWKQGDYETTLTEPESNTFFVVALDKTLTYDHVTLQAARTARIGKDATWVEFNEPFLPGATPVVIANPVTTATVFPYTVKVWGVTSNGFYTKLERQEAEDAVNTSFMGQYIYYIAATPGQGQLSDGKIITVNRNTETAVGGLLARQVKFYDPANKEPLALENPYIICGAQTNNRNCASLLRLTGEVTEETDGSTLTTGIKLLRQCDATSTDYTADLPSRNGDYIGWIAISDGTFVDHGSAIDNTLDDAPLQVRAEDGRIIVEGTNDYCIYSINGKEVSAKAQLPAGVYIVKAAGKTAKVLVP